MPEGTGAAVQLLDADPDLARELDPRRAREAAQRLPVRVIDVPRGRWDPGTRFTGGSRPLGLLILEGLMVREAAVSDHPAAELLGPRRPRARVGRRRRRGAAPAHDRVERARRDPDRDHRPGARRPAGAVAGDLRRAARPRRPARRAARRDAGDRAPDPRRRPPARPPVVPRRALGPRGAGRHRRLAAPLAPHAGGDGRRPPALGHDGAGPAHRPRRDRAPRRRRVAAARPARGRRTRSRSAARAATPCASSASACACRARAPRGRRRRARSRRRRSPRRSAGARSRGRRRARRSARRRRGRRRRAGR